METDNLVYQKVKEKNILKSQRLDFLNYLCLFGPCSTNELIKEVKNRNFISNPMDLNKLNRHPSVLKKMNLIKVNSMRKCKVSSSLKLVEILEVVEHFTGLKKKPTGKSLKILQSSLNAALLAVEIYNKPRIAFRTESYILLMINAWTKLFHAHIRTNQGEIYYYPKENREKIKKSWDISKCINHYNKLKVPVKANLELFISLRNEVEHGLVDDVSIDAIFFGECQALLYNYENFLISNFGEEYALNQSLTFSLQFSVMRNPNQNLSSKALISKEASDIVKFLNKYRRTLSEDVFNSQEFSVKLIQIPRVSNTNRADIAVKFIKYDELNEDDKKDYQKIDTLVKKQTEKIAVVNLGLLKPMKILATINIQLSQSNEEKLNSYDLQCLYSLTEVKPHREKKKNNPEKTLTKFCIYDQANEVYLYTSLWIDFILFLLKKKGYSKDKIREVSKLGTPKEKGKLKNLATSFSERVYKR